MRMGLEQLLSVVAFLVLDAWWPAAWMPFSTYHGATSTKVLHDQFQHSWAVDERVLAAWWASRD